MLLQIKLPCLSEGIHHCLCGPQVKGPELSEGVGRRYSGQLKGEKEHFDSNMEYGIFSIGPARYTVNYLNMA